MNDMLQQLMNMIENTRTIPALTDISMIGFAVLLVLGAINCILGYRLLRFWMMLCGFIIGAGVGFGVAYSGGVTEKYMYAVIMVGIGVVLAVIAFVSYKIGIFILGAGIGIGLGIYIFHPTSSLVFFFCLLLGAGLGVLAMRQAREILIVGTSLLGGAMAGVSAAKLGGLADFPYGLGMSAGFAILGMLIQFATNRRKRDEDDAAEDEDEFYEEAENSSDYVDPKEYIPQKRIKRRPVRQENRRTLSAAEEERLDEEIVREMMDDDDREGEELWKKISRREANRKNIQRDKTGKKDNMAKEAKTNAMRMLDRQKVKYEAFTYECDEFIDGLHSADLIGAPYDQSFKTLVMEGKSGGYYVFVVPIEKEVDRKAAAKAVGEKTVDMIHVKDILKITGYVRGGCSPLGMKKLYPTVFDASAENFDEIYVSGGRIGLTLKVNLESLLKVTNGKLADITMKD